MKRYEEYKPSLTKWVPSIPQNWKQVRGKNVFYNQKQLNADNTCENILSLTLKGVIGNNKENPIGLSPKDYCTYQIFEPNDLVFKLIDLENISTSRVGLVPERGIMSPAYIRLCQRGNENIRYMYYQYFDLYLRNIFNGLGAGVRSTLTASDLLNLPIMIPHRAEQDQIVRYLDWQVSKINRLIAAKRKEIERIQEHLDKSIEIMFDEIASSSNDSIPLGRHITSIESGTSVNSIMGTADNDSIGVLSTSCVYGNNFDLSQNKRVAPSDYGRVSCPVKKNTLIISRMNAPSLVGACGFSEKDDTRVYLPDRLWQVRFDNALMPEYAWRYLSTKRIKSWFATIATGTSSSMKNITKPQLKSIQIPFPSLEKQAETVRRIKTLCDKCNVACHVFEESIMHLIDLRTRLISDVVTGQIDVRGIEVPKHESVDDVVAESELEELEVE